MVSHCSSAPPSATAREAASGLLFVSAAWVAPALLAVLKEYARGLAARERLVTLYGNRARLELMRIAEGGTRVTVRLPYRELECPG